MFYAFLRSLGHIFCLISLCHGTFAVDNPSIDPIARYYQPSYLFNQEALLANPKLRDTFITLGFKENDLPPLPYLQNNHNIFIPIPSEHERDNTTLLEKEVLREFFKRRRTLYLCAIFQEFVGAASLPTFLLLAAGAVHFAKVLNADYFTSLMIMNAMYTFVTGSYGLKNLVGALLNPSNDSLLVYEMAYAKKKFALNYLDRPQPGEQQDLLYPEQLFLVARRSPENFLKTTLYFDTLLNIPYKSVQPRIHWTALKNSLKLYQKTAQEMILASCINHEYAYRSTLGTNPANKELLLLISPPGSGKTSLVKALGKHTELNMSSICLAGCTVESLIGTPDTPGLLLQTLVQLGQRNGILFLDELDKVVVDLRLLGILLPLLEASTKTFYSPYLRRSIDISHLFVIAAVNNDFSIQEHSSLKSRFPKRVDLTIENVEEMNRILLDDYLASKLTATEFAILHQDDSLMKDLSKMMEESQERSFRLPQSQLDLVIGHLRLRKRGVLL